MAGQPNSQDVPPYNLRLAEPSDIEQLLKMGKEFYDASPFPQFVEWDEDSAAVYIFGILDAGIIIVAETSDTNEMVGMIGMLYTPFPYNSEKMMASEVAFYIAPEHRHSGLAVAMKECAETSAELEKCGLISFMSLSSSPKGIERLYKQFGFRPIETAYLKAL